MLLLRNFKRDGGLQSATALLACGAQSTAPNKPRPKSRAQPSAPEGAERQMSDDQLPHEGQARPHSPTTQPNHPAQRPSPATPATPMPQCDGDGKAKSPSSRREHPMPGAQCWVDCVVVLDPPDERERMEDHGGRQALKSQGATPNVNGSSKRAMSAFRGSRLQLHGGAVRKSCFARAIPSRGPN